MVVAQYPLSYAPLFPQVVQKLELLPRTGWVQWKIKDPENVWEHILAVRDLAIRYRTQFNLSDDEFQDMLNMIEIHDWPEALVGDGAILGDEENVETLRAIKTKMELEAMEVLCSGHPRGAEVFALYQRYSGQTDIVAQLVKQLEKLQAVFKAAEYEQLQAKKGLTTEFIYYTRDLIKDVFLQSEFNNIKVTSFALMSILHFFH